MFKLGIGIMVVGAAWWGWCAFHEIKFRNQRELRERLSRERAAWEQQKRERVNGNGRTY